MTLAEAGVREGSCVPALGLALAALFQPIPAVAAPGAAAEVTVGLGGGVSADLPDRLSTYEGVRHTAFKPGAAVIVPLRFRWKDTIGLAVDLSTTFAGGRDRLTWSLPLGSSRADFYDDDHRAWLSSFDLRVGPELTIPLSGPFRPYVGVNAGVALVSVFHDLAGNDAGAEPSAIDADTAVLYDTSTYAYGAGALDPWSFQGTFVADARVGGRLRLGDRFDLWLEAGYGTSFVPSAHLRKTTSELQARRAAFAWNPVRAALGFAVRL
jgi:hypothetical protein